MAFIGLPVAVSGSSIVNSLIEGKTPGEAVVILAGQIDHLLGRVVVLEEAQIKTEQDVGELKIGQDQVTLEIERLRLENENLKLEAENIKAEAKAVAERQECDNLARNSIPEQPRWVGWGHTPTITTFYHRVEELRNDSSIYELNENRNNIKIQVEKAYQEAKPLYEAYVARCGQE